MVTQLGVVNHFILIPVLLCNNILHLAHERLASVRHRLARTLQTVLRLAHQRRLDAAGGNQLGRAGGHVVTRDDELLRRVAAADDAVGCLDEHVRGRRDRFGGADETLGPAVVLLVERGSGRRAATFAHNLLLRRCGGLDELGDGVGDCDGGFEDGAILVSDETYHNGG